MDFSGVPSTIKILFSWLENMGFAVVEERKDGPHNQLVTLGRDDCRVRLLADRGEWSIAVSFSSGEWIHPDVWEAYLDEFSLAGELSELHHQVQFLQDRLPEIEAAAKPEVEKELQGIGEEYMRRRLGVGPGP